jgi:hypothetical protein
MISKHDSAFVFKTRRISSASYEVKFSGYSLYQRGVYNISFKQL